MRSIKWKLIAMYLGLVLIVMIVSGTYILLSLRNIEINKSRQQLEIYAEKIVEQEKEKLARAQERMANIQQSLKALG